MMSCRPTSGTLSTWTRSSPLCFSTCRVANAQRGEYTSPFVFTGYVAEPDRALLLKEKSRHYIWASVPILLLFRESCVVTSCVQCKRGAVATASTRLSSHCRPDRLSRGVGVKSDNTTMTHCVLIAQLRAFMLQRTGAGCHTLRHVCPDLCSQLSSVSLFITVS